MNPQFLFQCLYFYIPGALANGGTVISRLIPFVNHFDYPVDANISYRNIRLIGPHKKMARLLFGIFFGITVGTIKAIWLDPLVPQLQIFSNSLSQNLIINSLLATTAPIGDLLKSIIKRQLKIDPHAPWIPFDEIDHSVFSLLMVKLFFPLSWKVIATTICLYAAIHFLANIIGYRLRIKSVPY